MFNDVWPVATGRPLLGGDEDPDVPLWKLHGSMAQNERTHAVLRFSQCARGVLLCTDVAARGLDFPAVTTIVQFDPPGEPAECVDIIAASWSSIVWTLLFKAVDTTSQFPWSELVLCLIAC